MEDIYINEDARIAIENSNMSDEQKQQALEDLLENGGAVIEVIDYQRVARDIRALSVKSAVPFLAGAIIAGLVILPDNLQPSIANIKSNNLNLDNFEILCVLFARNDTLRNSFLEQTAALAENGLFEEGTDQEGWSAKEFDICISLLRLTLK